MKQAFRRDLAQLKPIVAMTEKFFAAHQIDPALRYLVDLCVEELFVNMVTYNTETEADILLEMEPYERGIQVALTDYNVDRFDPRDAPPVDVNAPLEQRSAGGLGLYLVLKMADSIHYQYRNRTSKITFVVEGKVDDA